MSVTSDNNLSGFLIFVAILGTYVLLKFVLKLLYEIIRGLRVHILPKFTRGVDLKTRYGEWALVTGCTDGIGLAYSRELAQRGLNLVLVSRSKDKLDNVARNIETEFQVQTRIVQADFSKEGRDLYQRIATQLQGIEIGILINNVGTAVPYPMLMEETPEQVIWDNLTCNVTAGTMMTSLVIADMKKRGRGAILNMGSLGGYNPVPPIYAVVYGASKSYVERFSRGLHAECEGSGVTVQTMIPYFIDTKLVTFFRLLATRSVLVPSPETFAKHAVSTLGLSSYTTGYLPHSIAFWFIKLFPVCFVNTFTRIILKRIRTDYDEKHI